MRAPRASTLTVAVLAAALAACDGGEREVAEEGSLSPMARPDIVELLREGLAAERHPADGGGRAWREIAEGESGAVVAGGVGSFAFVYEAGPQGIRAGGAVYFQVSLFWGWSSPQLVDPARAGYTTVESLAQGVELAAQALGNELPRLVQVAIAGRDLRQGERIRLTYGAGSAGAVVDRNAERRSTFWFSVDGDGDGVRGLLKDSPYVEVRASEPVLLCATLTSTAEPGATIRLTLAVLDAMANAGCEVRGDVELRSEPEGLVLPESVELLEGEGGQSTIELAAGAPGTWRVHASLALDGDVLETWSNPLWVSADEPAVYWGDLHGHSHLSDGTGLPEDYLRYARDVAALDVAVLTDHDHFGMRFLDQEPELWAEIREQVHAFDEPGRFVALLGYEWTSWLYGHRHVLYFAGEGEVWSSLDPAHDTPPELWSALRGQEALTFAHHSAGGSIATDWTFAPDPVLEPLTEIASIQGSSEAADSPARISPAVPGNFVRDALDRGYRLGFVGSGDSHDGHPGLAHLSPFAGYRRPRHGEGETPLPRLLNGGLAAIRADELTRPALLAAMRARRTYATNGPRILLDAEWNGHPMGASVPARELAEASRLSFRIAGTAPIEAVELVRSGALRQRFEVDGLLDVEGSFALVPAAAGEYAYLRVIQRDGGLAWSSPFFVE